MPGKKLKTTVRQMSDVEKAYIGAMLDGEGSVGRYCVGSKYGDYWQSIITLTNTDLEIISAVLRTTGVGNVSLKDPPSWHRPSSALGEHRKPCWVWRVTCEVDAASITKQASPYSVKCQNHRDGLLGTGESLREPQFHWRGF